MKPFDDLSLTSVSKPLFQKVILKEGSNEMAAGLLEATDVPTS